MNTSILAQRNGWPRALWAGFLSLLLPGLGQVYGGAGRLGIILFVSTIALDLSWIALTWRVAPTPGAVAGSAGVIVLFRLVVSIHAAHRVRTRSVGSPVPWYCSTWFAAVAMIAINVGLQLVDAFPYSPGWRSFHIASASNLPTLLPTDYVLVGLRHPGADPTYGDVVVFRLPQDPKMEYAKRVVGLPGDHVQLREGIQYLNGKPVPREAQGLAAPFSSAPRVSSLKQYRETLPNGRAYMIVETSQSASQSTAEFTVPLGHIFVLGDNRGNSLDSRFKDIGYIPIPNVIGTVHTIYWTSLYEPARLLSRVH